MDIGGIDYLGIDRVLKRKSGKIIEERDGALLVRDSISGTCFTACEDTKIGLVLLDRYARKNCNLLLVEKKRGSGMRSKSPELMNEIKKYIEDYYLQNRKSSSTTKIAEAVYIARGTAYKYLGEMAEKNMI